MKKRILAFACVLCILLSVPVYAATKKVYVPDLSFNGTTANCYISVTEAGKDIDITLELWHGSTLIHSWSDNGTSHVVINEYSPVTSGYTYTLLVTGTIGGVPINSMPVTDTCP